ncbi:MAG: hypothetical protein RL514_3833 [Verrucomicrobiota bacterium]|jgi:hypothetical protein
MAKLSACGLLLALLLLVGCGTPSGGGGSFGRSDVIHELHLLVLPVPLKSSQPGAPSGFAVRVFASNRKQAKGMPIRAGTLELLGYAGALGEAELRAAQPARVWSFPATGLAGNATVSSLGVGYQFALSWEGVPPKQNRLTLVARFTPPSGPAVYTAPSVLPLAGR